MSDVLRAGWLTTEEAQALTGYTGDYLSRLARTGQVTAAKLGGRWIFERAGLIAYKATVRPGPKRRNHAAASGKPGPKTKQA